MSNHVSMSQIAGLEFFSSICSASNENGNKSLYIASNFNDNMCLVSVFIVRHGRSEVIRTFDIELAVKKYNSITI